MGSTSYITNLDGDVVQHIEYVPFGEVFLEERNNKWNTPYLFNAKELDEETGLYYYGARYYDPRVSLWLGVDPMQETYPNISTYAYCIQNPVIFVDPDGRDWTYGTSVDKNGNNQIRLIFFGAIRNQSGKKIDLNKMVTEQKKAFEDVFGQGNVTAVAHIRIIDKYEDLKYNEHLIDIVTGDNFDSSHHGGIAGIGGKYIRLNSDYINEDGSFVDKKTMIHEIGHTGGLLHPFEHDKYFKKADFNFYNGNKFEFGEQYMRLGSSNDPDKWANFMSYTSEAVHGFKSWTDTNKLQKYFMEKIGKATKGQVQTIINNINKGNLNSENDLPNK